MVAMFLESLLFFLYLLSSGESTTNHTLVMISHRGVPLDVRHVPKMMAQAVAAADGRTRFLSEGDSRCERCLAQDGLVRDLSVLGVQIVDSKCEASPKQMKDYLLKAKGMLGIEVDCEPDSDVSIAPLAGRTTASEGQVARCTGGNPLLGTNDPGSSCQGNLEIIRFRGAQEAVRSVSRGLRNVVLAIVDSGVDVSHPDLINQFWKNPDDGSIGFNFLDGNTNVNDENGHGTHVAGIAGAQTNNSIGIAGVADVKLMILKFMGSDGNGPLSGALNALDYAVRMGAAVSSHSYGGNVPSRIFENAIRIAANAGHVVVAASGNDGINLDETPTYPCSYSRSIPSMLCVGASSSTPTSPVSLASFSNIGSVVNIVAPGVNILSTYLSGSYAFLSGTSMATPQVAGVAAVLATLGLAGQSITDSITRSRTASLRNALSLQNLGELDALNAVNEGLGQPTTPPRQPSSARLSSSVCLWSVGLLFVIITGHSAF
ncbi:protease, putative [Perkinsus marinus ATCC 50983]|uniref:subtilisin n=1 Tax=Perkinsus marinus (strain ATCC 50983 / TXsc) TaxID=423536 RepID=C5LI22_PERM5|nr:protease, putative [Perkinsus marinus ATCC 50983]EER03557.1 protease, putative [Perkinsus marinus ATCC 50983]|eukprot:XP_002771741.1 protease, putative [Perkinsus marinus ATCC 50983]